MRVPSIAFVALATVGIVNAQGSLASWHPAGPGDCTYICRNLLYTHIADYLQREALVPCSTR
jgi:hypothetical protein